MITFLRLLKNDLKQLRWYTVIAGALITAFAAECAIAYKDYIASIDDVLAYSLAYTTVVAVVFACAVGYSDLGNKRRAFLLSKPISTKAVIFSKYISGIVGLFFVTISPVIFFWLFTLATGTSKEFWQLTILNPHKETTAIIGIWTLIVTGIYSFSFLFTVLWHQPFYAGLFGLFITGVTVLVPFILPIPLESIFTYSLWLVPAAVIIVISIGLSIYATRKQWSMGIGFKGLLWTITIAVVLISSFLGRQMRYMKPVDVFEFSDLTTKIFKTADNEITIYPQKIPVNFTNGKITFPKGQPAKLSRKQYNEKVSAYSEQYFNNVKSSHEKYISENLLIRVSEKADFYVNDDVFQFRAMYVFRKKADSPQREKSELTANGIHKDDYEFDKYIFEFIDNNGNVCSTMDMTAFVPDYYHPEDPDNLVYVACICIDEKYKKINILYPSKEGQLLVIDIADPSKPNITEQHKFTWTGITQNNYPILPFEYIDGKERVLMSLKLEKNMGSGMTCYIEDGNVFQVGSEHDINGFQTVIKKQATAYDEKNFVLETVGQMRKSIFRYLVDWRDEVYRNIVYSDGFIYCFVDRNVIVFDVRNKSIKNAGHFVIPPLEELITIESVSDGYIAMVTGISDIDHKSGSGMWTHRKKIYTFKAGKGLQPD